MNNVVIVSTIVIVIVVVLLLTFLNKKEKYKVMKEKDPVFEANKRVMQSIYPDLNKIDIKPIYDCTPEDSNTYDKSKIEVCVKNKKGEYLPPNKIRHIILHELAHYDSPETDKDHKTPEFIANYNRLMSTCIKNGILDVRKLK